MSELPGAFSQFKCLLTKLFSGTARLVVAMPSVIGAERTGLDHS